VLLLSRCGCRLLLLLCSLQVACRLLLRSLQVLLLPRRRRRGGGGCGCGCGGAAAAVAAGCGCGCCGGFVVVLVWGRVAARARRAQAAQMRRR
jgi:hypothetical protein